MIVSCCMARPRTSPTRVELEGNCRLQTQWTAKIFLPAAVARMVFRVVIDQPLWLDGGVDLRRRDTCMPEHFLNRTQIGAAGEQVRGERMTQAVRLHILGDA